ncbi:negative regulator of systemic acquired resistance SNI1 isoform X2 [Macadamia integrifolia]|uniref:negative regulator of systemic acquired resistance SNI1 isoform X2 n=1 Tax=Macadamia integrifolia TaxID=60698 RepID=UPI001C5290E8|nr:negative regulator of systemic acquired resistance SNI1 isoform X2 [Macadamia integrifolia]
MEKRGPINRVIEENILAILDASGLNDARDYDDDRLTFLEAVRASSIVAENTTAPSSKIYGAVFQILRDGRSLELAMASYQLLRELDERFPRVYLSHGDKSESPCRAPLELHVVKEAWSPFVLGLESSSSGREVTDKNLGEPMDSYRFLVLVQGIIQLADGMSFQVSDPKHLGNMLLFQYLVSVLEGDFLPRNAIYKETKNWVLLRESLLNMLLGSRRISYRNLIKDCLSIISKGFHSHAKCSTHEMEHAEKSPARTVNEHDPSWAFALVELEKETCIALQKFLELIMELDKSKKQADLHGQTSRADGVRTPLVDVILDELTYDDDLLLQFLLVFYDPKWKMEIILQYFRKYISKPATRTRRSNVSSDDDTFHDILRCFSNGKTTKSIIRKISVDVGQLLLAHGFQEHGDYAFCKRSTVHCCNDPYIKNVGFENNYCCYVFLSWRGDPKGKLYNSPTALL